MFRSSFGSSFQNPFPSDSVAAPSPLFYDTFTGSNGTALTSHIPDVDVIGGGWQKIVWIGSDLMTAVINSNKCRLTTATAVTSWVADVGESDVTINVTVTRVSSSAPSVTVRSNALSGSSNRQFIVCVEGGALSIYEWDGSSLTLRAATAGTFSTGTPYDLIVTANGTSISGTIGATSVNYSSSNYQTNTRFGITDPAYNTTQSDFENFEVLP